MRSAFISYAHEDQEFVLALAEKLNDRGLSIRFDQIVLRVGDSLIDRLARVIQEDDFLIAVISPDSVRSEWCRKEIAMAMTDGISEHGVKVLPVRVQGAEMMPALRDTFWADADRHDLDGMADLLAAAIEGHAIDQADPAAVGGEARAPGGSAWVRARADEIDNVAEKVFDLLAQWDRCRDGEPSNRLEDQQRRLHYTLDALPAEVRDGLPLVTQVSNATWEGLFRAKRAVQVEQDLRQELKAVRDQIIRGLPVPKRWFIATDHGEVSPGSRDATAYLWEIERNGERRRVVVYISGTAMGLDDRALPPEVVAAKATRGRSVATTLLSLDLPPREVMVSTIGVGWPLG